MPSVKRFTKSKFSQALIGWAVGLYLRLIHNTVRWRRDFAPGAEALLTGPGPCIACFWHGRMLTMPWAWPRPRREFHMLISGHRDGALIARAMVDLGFGIITGSSRRGGANALRSLHKVLSDGDSVGITPDGPRGPRMRAKIGAIKAAQLSGVSILPTTASVRRSRFLASWDRFCLAYIFSRGVILYGTPISVPRRADKDELERLRLELEQQLNALTAEADRRCGHVPIEPAALPDAPAATAETEAGAGRVRHAGA